MADVALSRVAKRFRKAVAITDLSLTVREGEFFVLLGPTGAGKTTTLRLVAGLERPDEGSIFIGGRDARTLAPAERDVAFVFQQYSLYPHLSVFDNLAFPLRAPGKKLAEADIKQRVEAVAKTLRIDEKLRNPATRLSGGEMQRVSIGRALVRDPAVFLMDEPLSSLDAKLREELRLELKHLQGELGATILYVTHDQVEAMTLGDRVGILIDGRLRQVGPPYEVYEFPVDTAAALQMGALPINLLPAERFGIASNDVATVGVRPEHVVAIAPERGSAQDARGRVTRLERLGAEDVVTLDWGGITVQAAQPPAFSEGVREAAAIRVDATGLMLFGRDGKRLVEASAAVGATAHPEPMRPEAVGTLLWKPTSAPARTLTG